MYYYCIFVKTGTESHFKTEAKKFFAAEENCFDGEVLIFRQVKKIVKLNKVYDDLLFPGYVFLRTQESDAKKFCGLMRIEGFIKFLPDNFGIKALAGKDLEAVESLESGGEIQGFVRARFDKDDRIVIVSGPLCGMKGKVVSVNRRNQKIRYCVATESGARILNLSYFDLEKQDWSEEESAYIDSLKERT